MKKHSSSAHWLWFLVFGIWEKTKSQKPKTASRPAYVFLISVLFIGAIAMATASTLIVLGVGSMKTSIATMHSVQAMHNAETCVEQALRALRTSASYDGDEVITLTNGTCELLPIGGYGNTDRIICAKGMVGDTVRRVQVAVAALRPIGLIDSWQEVADFSLCDE